MHAAPGNRAGQDLVEQLDRAVAIHAAQCPPLGRDLCPWNGPTLGERGGAVSVPVNQLTSPARTPAVNATRSAAVNISAGQTW
jgi:hypothetical protein